MAAAVDNRQRRVPVSPARVAATVQRALQALGRSGGVAEVLIVDDAEIAGLNASYRGVRRPTDVLAFPLEAPETAAQLVGQIVVSAQTAGRQARRLGLPVALELDLLVTHGTLHLVGYDDRDPVEAALMHERERQILASGARVVPSRLWRGLLPAAPRPPAAGRSARRHPRPSGGR
jgi:probable rRNA maturation factor